MRNRRKTLAEWIKEARFDPDKEDKCSAMSLVHMNGSAEREIHTTRFGSSEYDDAQIAGMFQGKAETYCQDLPGVQTFCMLAFYGKDPTPLARHPFLINGETEYGGLATEAPTEKGMRQQEMRHNEAITQLNYRQTQVIFEQQTALINALGKHAVQATEDATEAATLVRTMLADKIQADHTQRMTEMEYSRKTEERKYWMKYAPALVNNILGREVFPQGMADTALIESFIEKIGPAEIEKLSSFLPPELMAPLAARAAKYVKAKNEQNETIKQLGAAPIDPEDEGIT